MTTHQKYNDSIDDASESSKVNRMIFDALSKMEAPSNTTKAEAWDALQQRIAFQTTKPKVRVLRFGKYAAAASIVVLLGVGVLTYILFHHKTIDCGRAQQLVAELPDHSLVHLNSLSTIEYKPFAWEKNRTIHLEGEAFFEVKKGSRFSVETSQGLVTVLGTSFNVFARKNNFTVVCKTGRVSVKAKNEVILTAGNACTFVPQSKKLQCYQPNIEREAAWLQGKFWFDKVALSDVFSEIERQFNVEIEYSATQQRFYTGYFTNKNLDNALQLVCAPMQLRIEKHNSKIIIK